MAFVRSSERRYFASRTFASSWAVEPDELDMLDCSAEAGWGVRSTILSRASLEVSNSSPLFVLRTVLPVLPVLPVTVVKERRYRSLCFSSRYLALHHETR